MASKDLVKGYCKESKCEYDVYTKEKMDELLEGTTEMIGDKYSSSSTYSKGDLIIYNNTIHKCNDNITTPEEWNSAHWVETSLSNELKNKQNTLTFDSTPTSNSTNPVTSGGVKSSFDEIDTSIDNINTLIGSINTSLSNKTDNNKFAVLTGTQSSAFVNIDYPAEFNKNNCVVLSISYFTNNKWNYIATTEIGGSSYGTPLAVELNDNKVYAVIPSSSEYSYKIVLMRID